MRTRQTRYEWPNSSHVVDLKLLKYQEKNSYFDRELAVLFFFLIFFFAVLGARPEVP